VTEDDHRSARWLEHIGITVPDIEEATRYFTDAFDAEVLYDTLQRGSEPYRGPEAEQLLGVPPGTELIAFRMLQLQAGPGIELFEYKATEQRPAVGSADLGLQHFAVYVDDIGAACERVQKAGGQVLVGPRDLPGPESGPGNQWCYTRAPWGTTIELITSPSPMAYEQHTSARRWKPERLSR
jgi:catechol 2,3-dioxygenase-like lactoylglutathione lyase family enzyme